MSAPQEDGPSILYHYADVYGLLGIVDPSWSFDFVKREQEIGYSRVLKLLMSDVRFMNDTEELRFGAQLLVERLRKAAGDDSTPSGFQAAFEDIHQFLDIDAILKWPRRCFAACFCAEGDLLSQWRAYAGGTGGFALGLDRDALENRTYAYHRGHLPGEMQPPSSSVTKLKRVVYGEKKGIAAIDEHLRQLYQSDERRALTDQRPQTRNLARNLLFSRLVESVITIKADAFKEEKEWRLFSPSDAQFPVDVRARTRGLLPYVVCAVNVHSAETAAEREHHHREHPVIRDLVVGPGPEQAEQVLAAKELLHGTGHDPDVVRPSKVTYR